MIKFKDYKDLYYNKRVSILNCLIYIYIGKNYFEYIYMSQMFVV